MALYSEEFRKGWVACWVKLSNEESANAPFDEGHGEKAFEEWENEQREYFNSFV